MAGCCSSARGEGLHWFGTILATFEHLELPINPGLQLGPESASVARLCPHCLLPGLAGLARLAPVVYWPGSVVGAVAQEVLESATADAG